MADVKPAKTRLDGANDMEKLKDLSSLKYEDQAKWFLNGFWNVHEDKAPRIREYAHKLIELDEKSGKEGNEVDEFTAHRFLEHFGETLTVREMREKLREIDIDTNKKVSLAEYLIFAYDVDWHELVHAPQGDNSEEVEKAQRMVAEAQQKLAEAQQAREDAITAANAAREATKAAKAAEEDSAAKAATAAQAQADAEAAEAELRDALATLEAEEKSYNDRISDLERRCEEGGIVSRNKAKNELEQAKGEDPLPLRRAKISQEAAVRKQEKAVKAAADARAEADASLAAAVEARAAAEEAEKAAEAAAEASAAAVAAADQSMKEAEDFLEEAKSKGGVAQGSIWWMEQDMEDARKLLPQSKQGTGYKW